MHELIMAQARLAVERDLLLTELEPLLEKLRVVFASGESGRGQGGAFAGHAGQAVEHAAARAREIAKVLGVEQLARHCDAGVSRGAQTLELRDGRGAFVEVVA